MSLSKEVRPLPYLAFDTFSAEHPMPKPPLGYRLWLRVRKENVNE